MKNYWLDQKTEEIHVHISQTWEMSQSILTRRTTRGYVRMQEGTDPETLRSVLNAYEDLAIPEDGERIEASYSFDTANGEATMAFRFVDRRKKEQ